VPALLQLFEVGGAPAAPAITKLRDNQ